MKEKMNQLRFLKMEIDLLALSDYKSLNFIGNKLRGAMGRSMVRLFYEEKGKDFKRCKKEGEGVYYKVFKPEPIRSDFTSTPAPFVLQVSELNKKVKKGERVSFSICVFGNAVVFWKEIILSLKDVFQQKSNIFNQSFQLIRVVSSIDGSIFLQDEDFVSNPMANLWTDTNKLEKEAYEEEIRLIVEFKSAPLLKEETADGIDFSRFMDMIFLRLASMMDLYEEEECILPYGLLLRKPKVLTEFLREGDKLKLRFTGKIGRYLSYIDIGSHLHVGKKSTYGFGEYRYYFE